MKAMPRCFLSLGGSQQAIDDPGKSNHDISLLSLVLLLFVALAVGFCGPFCGVLPEWFDVRQLPHRGLHHYEA